MTTSSTPSTPSALNSNVPQEGMESQEHIDFTSLASSVRKHMRYVESIVDTSVIPVDTVEQASGRTHMWATQYFAHAQTEYLQYFAFATMQSALQLLQKELDLAVDEKWRASHQLIWQGVHNALEQPEAGSPLDQMKQTYTNARKRAALSEFDAHEQIVTFEMNDQNLDNVLSAESCVGMTFEQSNAWLMQKIILAASINDANQAVKAYQAEHSDRIISKIPMYTSGTLQIVKQFTPEELNDKFKKYRYTEPQLKLTPVFFPGDKPKELEDSLASSGAFDIIKPKAVLQQNVEPTELIRAMADEYQLPVYSAEEWRATNSDRTKPCIVKNFDFRSMKKPELGRAQYLLIGPAEACDIRIELKHQTVSGSAGDKLPLTVYKLNKIENQATYAKTILGVADVTYFGPDALAFAAKEARASAKVVVIDGKEVSQSKVVFVQGKEVIESLHQAFKDNRLWHSLGVTTPIVTVPSVAPVQVAPTQVVPNVPKVAVDPDELFGMA